MTQSIPSVSLAINSPPVKVLLPETAIGSIPSQLGMASIVGRVYGGVDPDRLMQEIVVRLDDPAQAAGAWLDLSILRRTLGDIENAEIFQTEALNSSRIFRQPSFLAKPLRLLAFKAAGNFMANTPVEFMLQGANIELISLYVDDETEAIGAVPDHDFALLAIGESPENRSVLRKCQMLLEHWHRKIFNFNVETILQLDRSLLWRRLSEAGGTHFPWTLEFGRQELLSDAQKLLSQSLNDEAIAFPLIIRPEGAHAGTNTVKVDSMAEFSTALTRFTADSLTVSQFIDYRSDDGQFRKYRIALINGVAYPVHMAISSKWMVHYLNAGMTESALKRDEEALWLHNFNETFAVRHATDFEALCNTLHLDYFAIDCAETKEGKLLIFEIDTAMIVHCMDVGSESAYKRVPMQKLFGAFQKMLMSS